MSKQHGSVAPSDLSERDRRGTVIILAAVMMVILFVLVGFAVDVGYLKLARTQLQCSADAAALAAAWELLDEDRLRGSADNSQEMAAARLQAIDYAARNAVAGTAPALDPNYSNDPAGEIVFGRLANPENLDESMSFLVPSQFNSVQIRLNRTSTSNGQVPLFFMRVIGLDSAEVSATATATFEDGVTGFRVDENTGNASLLPFAVALVDWVALLGGQGQDNFSYDALTGSVWPGADGILELNMFPGSAGGPGNGNGNGGGGIVPGNFGTVDIGSPNNSTAVIERQIRDGVTAEDLQWHGGTLELDAQTGTLPLGGDTGISAGISDAVASIIGQARAIPLYGQVTGQGNGATFFIVGFGGIRIVESDLTGSAASKHITIQPAFVVDDAALTRGGPHLGDFIYQPARLTR